MDVRLYNAVLTASESSSTYYMVPVSATRSSENNVEVVQDTVWRVNANLEEQELVFNDIFNESLKSRWYYDSLFPMRWQILPDQTYIDSFLCSKATCSFRGRSYEAWFCPGLSVPFGPWKMGGLPGPILRLQDLHHYLTIDMISVRRVTGLIAPFPHEVRAYSEYIASGNRIRKLIRVSTSNSDCVDCETSVKFHSWEKVFVQ
jgi:GLPGLI family protein